MPPVTGWQEKELFKLKVLIRYDCLSRESKKPADLELDGFPIQIFPANHKFGK
jgi:hypothetical protein